MTKMYIVKIAASGYAWSLISEDIIKDGIIIEANIKLRNTPFVVESVEVMQVGEIKED
jgi:hypothetical protein